MKPPGKTSSPKRTPGNKKAWEKLTPTQIRKALARVCITPHCRSYIPKKCRSFTCDTCRAREFAAANPIRIKWLNLKKSAKRRGKEWRLLSYECFACLARIYGYDTFQEKNAATITVDRVDEAGAYCFGNIAFIPNSDNIRKSMLNRRAGYLPHNRRNFVSDPDLPF